MTTAMEHEDGVSDTETTDPTEPEDATPAPTSGPASRGGRGVVVLAALALVALVAAVVTTMGAHRAQSDADARTDALDAARTRVPALLSYDAGSLEADLEVAKEQTTGAFSTDYATLLTEQVEPAARKQGLSTQAEVAAAGVVSTPGDDVVVLVFLTQTTTAADGRQSKTGSRVEVTMHHTGDTWKIAELKPL